MPLVFTYSDPGGIEEPAVSVSLSSNSVRFGTLQLAEAASVGEAATSGLEVDDPDGTWDFVGLRQLLVRETSAPSNNQIVLSGIIQDRKVSRDDSMLTGAARRWSIDLTDYNYHLGKRVFTDADAKRPAETAGDRLRWLLSSAAGISWSMYDLGHVTYPTTNLDATDYRGQRPTDLLADCAVEGGYNFWLGYNEAAGKPELFFMHPGSVEYDSGVTISNDPSEVDDVVGFAPSDDAELTRSPSRIAFGVYLAYAKGSVYVRNQTTGAQFAKVDQTAPMSNVKTEARATRVANRFLAVHDTEEDKISCSIWVPAASVNAVRPGHLVWARFAHFPGYDDTAVPMRVDRRVVAQDPETGAYIDVDDSEIRYRLDLELSEATDYPVDPPAPANCGLAIGDGWDIWWNTIGGTKTSSATATFTLTPGKQYRLVVYVDSVLRMRPEAYTVVRAKWNYYTGSAGDNWDPDPVASYQVETYPIAANTTYGDWFTYTGISQTAWFDASVGTVHSTGSTLNVIVYVECV